MTPREQEMARHEGKLAYIRMMEESCIYAPECAARMRQNEEETHSRIMANIDKVGHRNPNSLGS